MLEVLTPGNEVYTTLEEFKAFQGLTDAAQDAYWQAQITSASEVVSEYCGRPLCSEAVRETFRSGQETKSLVLSRWPISGTPVVRYGTGSAVVQPSGYEVDVRCGILRGVGASGDYVSFSGGVWVVTYSGGFAAIPQAVKQAVWHLAKEQEALGKLKAGLKSRRIEGAVAESYFDPDKLVAEVPPLVKLLLRRYVER